MKLLITGGAGCLGSNLIEHLIDKTEQIIVIDNFSTGKKEVLPTNLPNLSVYEGSINDIELLKKIFKKYQPSHVIHSAASYKDPDNWIEDVNTNIIGSINVGNLCKEFNVELLINFQTALCYGIPSEIPIPLNHSTFPFTSYGISKTAGESYLLNLDLRVVSLRLANICAPRLSIGPIPTFYQRLKENKDCFCSETVRDFLSIEDFISLIDILFNTKNERGIFNVSTGKGNSIKEIFDEVVEHLNIDITDVPILPPSEDDVPVVVLDPKETNKILGWEAKVDFKSTIKKQLDWYDKFGVTDIYSHLKEKSGN